MRACSLTWHRQGGLWSWTSRLRPQMCTGSSLLLTCTKVGWRGVAMPALQALAPSRRRRRAPPPPCLVPLPAEIWASIGTRLGDAGGRWLILPPGYEGSLYGFDVAHILRSPNVEFVSRAVERGVDGGMPVTGLAGDAHALLSCCAALPHQTDDSGPRDGRPVRRVRPAQVAGLLLLQRAGCQRGSDAAA